MDLTIRPVKIEDAVAIYELKRMNGVKENVYGITSERIEQIEEYISSLTDDEHFFVAEIHENLTTKVIGVISLKVKDSLRMRHCGEIVVFVHKSYQGKGIGKKLLGEIIDIADNWLMLVRLELDVFIDNEKAISLYKSFGFEVEGVKKYSYIRHGKYDNVFLMARYNKKLIQ